MPQHETPDAPDPALDTSATAQPPDTAVVAETLRCEHRPPCPGCPRLGEALGPELAPLRELAAAQEIELEVAPRGAALGYRVRARLAVRGRRGVPRIGIFEQGTHRVVATPHCLVHHPLVNEVAQALAQAMRSLQIEPYVERTQRGLVRYLQVAVERGSQTAQVVLVVNSEQRSDCDALIERLRTLLDGRLHSLFVSPHLAQSNAILGPRCVRVCGAPMLRERIAGAEVCFPPDAFGQANLDEYERIVGRIRDWAGEGAKLVEYHAGTGAIGLALLPRAARVDFVESGAGSLQGLQSGLAALPPALRERARLHAGRAEDHLALARGAGVVIVDPPRKGLDAALRAQLAAAPPQRLIYLSCDTGAFERDVRELLAGEKLRLAELVAWDLFPHTGHVETLARFERV